MKVVTIVGARPQFVKAAPVSRALAAQGIAEVLVHTGQHYDPQLSDVFFEQLKLRPPDHHLGIGSAPHGAQTGRMLEAIEAVLAAERPEWTLVYGDTNSTLAGALAAAKLGVPVAHVEAGLRSFNRAMPEEINRVVADHLSGLLLCPTDAAVRNLAAEGITRGVRRVGDVMYDSVLFNLRLAEQQPDPLAALGVGERGYYLATLHRPVNTDDPARLRRLIEELAQLDAPVVLPLHPRTAKALEAAGIAAARGSLRPTGPASYLDMLILERHARVILTDSGGVQKEACFFGIPCITLRAETEWVETVEAGWNVLVDADAARLRDAIARVAKWDRAGAPFGGSAVRRDLYGDGHAAEAIAQVLMQSSAQ
ncbi:MAG TPA: UDP-N-acetylglucosamine 2-epimerase (non-hydrolyzing) [Planctomycetota bacterium]|nr:UDP-N-acetylglucosamine 2-epimerase (non-hydrolyzing) [Planctomycetota bacterium]